jgi:hypothetical protein
VIRRLLRRAFVLALIAGAIGGAVVVARKLMGGLGPEPGSSGAPIERPSLVPDPSGASPSGASTNGNGSAAPSQTADL